MKSTEPGCFRSCVLGVFGKKALGHEGGRGGFAWALFHDVWTCGAKVLEY